VLVQTPVLSRLVGRPTPRPRLSALHGRTAASGWMGGIRARRGCTWIRAQIEVQKVWLEWSAKHDGSSQRLVPGYGDEPPKCHSPAERQDNSCSSHTRAEESSRCASPGTDHPSVLPFAGALPDFSHMLTVPQHAGAERLHCNPTSRDTNGRVRPAQTVDRSAPCGTARSQAVPA
jgi:hypothetical protein